MTVLTAYSSGDQLWSLTTRPHQHSSGYTSSAPNPFLLSLPLTIFKKISTFVVNEWFSHCAVLISFLSLLFLATKVYSGWVNAYVCVFMCSLKQKASNHQLMRILNELARTNSLMSLIYSQSKQKQMYQSTYFKSYTDHNYKRNTFVFAPIFYELNSKI